jgi:hypothetical protein
MFHADHYVALPAPITREGERAGDIWLALDLSPGRLRRQSRKLPTKAPADEAIDSVDTVLDAQARWRFQSFELPMGPATRPSDVTLVARKVLINAPSAEQDSCLVKKATDEGLRISLNFYQIVRAEEALR